jgi:hypothetical protein
MADTIGDSAHAWTVIWRRRSLTVARATGQGLLQGEGIRRGRTYSNINFVQRPHDDGHGARVRLWHLAPWQWGQTHPPVTGRYRAAARDRSGAVQFCLALSKYPLGHIVAPEIGGAEIAERDLGGFVPGLAHQFGEAGALIAGGGGEAGAE